jgi:hypothetical protein
MQEFSGVNSLNSNEWGRERVGESVCERMDRFEAICFAKKFVNCVNEANSFPIFHNISFSKRTDLLSLCKSGMPQLNLLFYNLVNISVVFYV